LAHADEIHRRCIVNREGIGNVARKMKLDRDQLRGVVSLLSALGWVPSKERLALVAMIDIGLDNEDIAEMFGESEDWVFEIKMNAGRLRIQEPIPLYLEKLRGWHTPEDPSPLEIQYECERIRSNWDGPPRFCGTIWELCSIRSFSWDGRFRAFFSIIPDCGPSD
jgi:hypothetical protein